MVRTKARAIWGLGLGPQWGPSLRSVDHRTEESRDYYNALCLWHVVVPHSVNVRHVALWYDYVTYYNMIRYREAVNRPTKNSKKWRWFIMVPKTVEQIINFLFVDTSSQIVYKWNDTMTKCIDIFHKLTRICRTRWNERRVISSFNFSDSSIIVVKWQCSSS